MITAALRLEPERCWDKGAARNTPDGLPLAGRHKETYWGAHLPPVDDYLRLDKAITAWLDRLTPQQDFIAAFADSGGRVELQVFWSLKGAFDTTLPYGLICRLAEFRMGIEISPRP